MTRQPAEEMLSPSKPLLKLAFFGSDYFSINCLKEILPLYRSTNPIISQIDVITRSPKLGGRGMKQLKDVPISSFAKLEELPLLRADKKADFDALILNNYNLCIAVSYGRLIPISFLGSLQYGGLNVHPSILPKYSGPAPLHRALLNKDEITGVTVQTLHPTEFDKGDILSIKEYKVNKNETINSLSENLSTIGGKLLYNILEKRIYDKTSTNHNILKSNVQYSYAGKIKNTEREIDWSKFTVFDLVRRENTLGPLYTFKESLIKNKKNNSKGFKRIVLSGFEKIKISPEVHNDISNGSFSLSPKGKLIIKVLDGFVSVNEIKSEGFGAEDGFKFFNSMKKKFGNLDECFVTLHSPGK